MSSDGNDNDAIRVSDVSKRFRLQKTGIRTLKSAVIGLLKRPPRREFAALTDLNFTVRRGEALGIIGSNGAGKSTLLSLVAGTVMPSSGTIETEGTIASLLELGTGFHPDLSGRENVFLYGAIMGLSKGQMRERFDAVVEFAGLEEYIDQPVKHYSSGMYVRLAFSVAIEVDPDILLIDEILAVGDSEFQRKCLRKVDDFKLRGKTMLIVSHDLATIQRVSDRILLLDRGTVAGIGDPEDLVDQYEQLSRQRSIENLDREWGSGEIRFTGVEFVDGEGNQPDKFAWGEPLEARIGYQAVKRIENPVFGFAISDTAGQLVHGNNTQIDEVEIPYVEGEGVISLRFDKLGLGSGTYLFSFSVHSADHKTNYHRLDNCFPISVQSSKRFEGCCHMPCSWRKA